MKTALVSTFKQKCGVAKYFEELAYPLSKYCEIKIFSEKVDKEEKPIVKYDFNYIRDWKRNTFMQTLFEDLVSFSPEVIHFQYESTIFPEPYFKMICDSLISSCFPLVLTLHNVPAFNYNFKRPEIYNLKATFVVQNELMKTELIKWKPNGEIKVVPLGSTIFTPIPTLEARQKINLFPSDYYILQEGFWGTDKGMLQLIKTMPKIIKDIPNAKLIFAGSVHPLAPTEHKDYVVQCMKTAVSLGLKDKILFTGKFLSEEELNLYLSASDLIAINHQPVSGLFSASASAHRALSAGKPIIMNEYDIRLSEYKDYKHCLKINNYNIYDKIMELYNSSKLRNNLYKEAREYSFKSSYDNIAKEYIKIYVETSNSWA